MSSASNCEPFLNYADFLLNSLGPHRPQLSPFSSPPKAASRDLAPYLPPDAEGMPGTSCLFPPNDYSMAFPAGNLGLNDRGYSGNNNNKNNYYAPDKMCDDLINQWFAPSNQPKPTSTTTNAVFQQQQQQQQQQLFHQSKRQRLQPLKQETSISSSPAMTDKAVKHDLWRLSVNALELGTFYVLASPDKRISDLIPEIESKIFELYQVSIWKN